LVVLRKVGETNNQLKTKLKNISKCVSKVIPETAIDGITHKMGMIYKTAHSYQKNFDGLYGQVRDAIILESTWLGNFEPFTNGKVSSYIYDLMKELNQQDLIDNDNMNPFEVNVLRNERTLCEKIMSLVRFSHSQQPIVDLRNKIRHIYDIHMLLRDAIINDFFSSMEFDLMLVNIANDDIQSFKSNNSWLSIHPSEALVFSEIENTWRQIKDTYNTRFKQLLFGDLPSEKEIEITLNLVGQRLSRIDWVLKTL
jgi:hypothetical protein